MRVKTCVRLLLLSLLVVLPAVARAQQTGQLAGAVTGNSDQPLSGVTVVINEVAMAEVTDATGHYHLTGLPPGSYSVTFSLGDNTETAQAEVKAGQTTRLDRKLAWDVSYAETITVYSASRRRERVVEAPTAVTVVSEQEIDREASHGQLAKVLEFTPGAEITQSGLYDFNLNTRGFNSSLNRRVPALIDGRDPSVPFLMSVDWPSLSSMGDIASVELVRGPSSALYGTNAYNGVLNLTTKQPRYSQGGTFRLTGGELATGRADARWAGGLGESTFLKVLGSYTKSDDWYQSRNETAEYSTLCATPGQTGCLPKERVPLELTKDTLWLGGLRLDQYFGESFLTVEGGTSHAEGPVIQTGIGRVQVVKQDRPWARLNYSSEHFDVLGYYNKRDAPEQRALASGANLVLDETSWAGELQGNHDFAGSKGRLIGGLSYKDENIDTRDKNGVPTLTGPLTVGTHREAAYAQIEYAFTPKFKVVAAGRYDDSTLHAGQFSPKLALVLAPTSNQTIRLTYNEAFQSPNYSEFFLAAPAAAPANLAAAAAQFPQTQPLVGLLTALGFNNLQIVARGNDNLDVEKIKSVEIGYNGILGSKAYLTLDYYHSKLENFVTDLLPGVNPEYPQYTTPIPLPPNVQAGLNAFLLAALRANYAGLTTIDGKPAVVLSYTNAGEATTQGVEMGLNYYVTDHWNLGVNYNWFDWKLDSSLPGDRVVPNAPENQASATLAYISPRFDLSLGYRWVDGFPWAAGVFVGDVPTYSVGDVQANFRATEHIQIGLNISNVTDKQHWEAFGGDIIGRRALGTLTFTW